MIDLIKKNWRGILARLPLPMLAIPASYGVYEFTALFVPWWVAVIQAAAFETVYVGLAAYDNLSKSDKTRALAISGFAVVASVAYNTLAGMFRLDDNLLQLWRQDIVGVAILSALHGVPLALLAFLVSNFTLHGSTAKPETERAQSFSTDMALVGETHGENVQEIVIEELQAYANSTIPTLPDESVTVFSQLSLDKSMLQPPSSLPKELREAVQLRASHGSYPEAARFSDVSRETIRKRVNDARQLAPEWVAIMLQDDKAATSG